MEKAAMKKNNNVADANELFIVRFHECLGWCLPSKYCVVWNLNVKIINNINLMLVFR